jgi:hypothetical protein
MPLSGLAVNYLRIDLLLELTHRRKSLPRHFVAHLFSAAQGKMGAFSTQ